MTSPEQASSRAATLDAIQPSLQDGQDPKSSSPGGHDAGPSRAVPPSVSDLDPESYGLIERSLVRKADWAILPVVSLLYILNYIDRQNIAAAKLQGIMDDLDMSVEQFATALSILYVGYLPFQLPSNLLLSRLSRPGLYICLAAVAWGLVSACTAFVTTYKGLLVVRMLLGVAEAVFYPGVIYLLSAWYTKKEFATRIGRLYIGQQIGNAFGGVIAAGVLSLDGAFGIRGWRWLFLVEGSTTVVVGIACALFLPEYPYNARILNSVEKDLAVWRLRQEAGAGEGSDNTGSTKGFILSLRDPKLYYLILCGILSQAQGSVTNYFPSIVETLGYDTFGTLMLTAPPYVFAAFAYVHLTSSSDRTGAIYPYILLCNGLALVTYAIPVSTTSIVARYGAMMFMPWTSVGPQLLLLKTVNHHMPRPIAKRAAAVALLNAIGGSSNIWASYLYYAPPYYYAAFGTLSVCALLFALTITLYKAYIRGQNRLLDGDPDEVKQAMEVGLTQEQVDMGWRYEGF